MKTAIIIAAALGVNAPSAEIKTLAQGQGVVCNAEAGCFVLTHRAMQALVTELQQAALRHCPTPGTPI